MLGLSVALTLVVLVRRVKDGEGTRSSALSKTERSVARLEDVGLCVGAACGVVILLLLYEYAGEALLALAPALALEEGQV